jgi:hypothetical protein
VSIKYDGLVVRCGDPCGDSNSGCGREGYEDTMVGRDPEGNYVCKWCGSSDLWMGGELELPRVATKSLMGALKRVR